MKKLIYRLKATQLFHAAKIMNSYGQLEKSNRLFQLSCWYHEQAFRNGYDSSLFLLDFAAVLSACNRHDEALFFIHRADAEKNNLLINAA